MVVSGWESCSCVAVVGSQSCSCVAEEVSSFFSSSSGGVCGE